MLGKTKVPFADGYVPCWGDYERIVEGFQPSLRGENVFFYIAYFNHKAANPLACRYVGFERRRVARGLEDTPLSGVQASFYSTCVDRLQENLWRRNLGLLISIPVDSLPE